MVRENEAAGGACARGGDGRTDTVPARALGSCLHQLARWDSRLEYLAAAVVGASHSHLVLRRVRRDRRESYRHRAVPEMWGVSQAGPRCARHVVLVLALAVLHTRLAGQVVQGPASVLPDGRSDNCAGDS